jgi:flavin-dependent dehydrogenase
MAAMELARAGLRVVIADGSGWTLPKVGESLPGVGLRLLRSLGLAVSEFGTTHRRIGGNLTCWSSEELDATDFLCDPDGPGWRLSRRHFDEYLRAAAISAGARHLPFNVDGVTRSGESWELSTRSGEAIECRWLIEATGRSSTIARKLGVGRLRDEGLVAVGGFGAQRAGERFDRTLIEAVPEGWWYGAVLPEGEAILMLHVDPRAAQTARRDWLQALGRTLFVREFFPPSGFGEDLLVAEAGGSRLESFHGTNWVACGDAAMAFDPLSSQGIYSGMYSGMAAARAIVASDNGDASALARYANRLCEIRSVYRARLASSYASAMRWANTPFWAARRSLDCVASRASGTPPNRGKPKSAVQDAFVEQ